MNGDDLRGLYWNQGLFLTPQHFQLLEARPEAMLQARWRLLGADGWGVAQWRLREGGLENGEIEVTALEAILPDGTLVRAGGVDQPNAVLPMRSGIRIPPDHRGPVGLYVVLAAGSEGPAENEYVRGRRQLLISETQPDLFHPKDGLAAPVTRLSYMLETMLDMEPAFADTANGYTRLRLATLHALDGRLWLSRDYVPPSLSIAADPLIGQALRDAIAPLHHRALDFAELKRDRGIRSGTGTPLDVMRTLILSVLNRQIGQLRGLLARAGACHPGQAYQLLAGIIAELSSFTEEYDLDGALEAETPRRGLPAYDHEDILAGMRHALGLIRLMAARLTAGPEAGITLEFTGTQYEAVIPGPFFEGRNPRYYLLVESELGEPALADLMQRRAKLGAPGEPSELHDVASRGLHLEYQPHPPEDLPRRSSRFVYFQINPRQPEWLEVEERGAICLLLPDLAPQTSRVKLIKAE